jgi:cyclase
MNQRISIYFFTVLIFVLRCLPLLHAGYQDKVTKKIQEKTTKKYFLVFSRENQNKGLRMDVIKIMPCLDMKEGRVVKGVNFVNLRDAGDPVENASFYQEEGADELAMLDIAATLENRKTRLEWVRNVSSEITIPLTVGGGISSIEDIKMVFEAGADKISMNSAAVNNPKLIEEAAKRYTSERITIAVDARRNSEMPSGFELVVSGGTKPAGQDAVHWAKQCQQLGAGIILPTSMDGDGTLKGYDLEFTKAISDAVDLPVVASGGAGKLEHFYQAVTKGGAQVLLAASVFHFRTFSIKQVKEYLQNKGIKVNI